MSITAVTLCIVAITTTLGMLWSFGILKWGISASAMLQAPNRQNNRFVERLPLTTLNLAILFAGTAVVLPFFEQAFDTTAPTVWLLVVQTLGIFLVDDAFFYWWHRILHENKYLYRKIHKIHHRAFAPLPMDYLHVHPIEWLVGAIGSVAGVGVVHIVSGSINAWAFWLFIVLRQVHELNIHSGYKSVFLHKLFPVSPAEHHDMHHAKPHSGNYGSILYFWDKVFETHQPVDTWK